METILIDTNILIGRARREPKAMAALAAHEGALLALCDAVVAEVLAGARNRSEYDAMLRELNEHFEQLPLMQQVTQHFRWLLAHTGRDHGVHFADYLIAATAMAHGVPLLTLNKKHFLPIKGLRLV